MADDNTIKKVIDYCNDNFDSLNLKTISLPEEYYYGSLPLCVIDSVFSIGVRYQVVTKVVNRLCERYPTIARKRKDKNTLPEIDNQIPTTSDFLQMLGDSSFDTLASNIFDNIQRTSTRGGSILKVEAAIRFLKVLRDFNVERFQDVSGVINNDAFESCIKNIPGQRSGISLKYFFMLSGSNDLIKPDRWIVRFLENATDEDFHSQKNWQEDCQSVLSAATLQLKKTRHDLTPKLVDYAIWNYMKNKGNQIGVGKLVKNHLG